MTHLHRVALALIAVLYLTVSTIWALQGVVEQQVSLPCPNQPDFATTLVELEGDSPDAENTSFLILKPMGDNNAHVNWASGSSFADGQKYSEASAEVLVFENLDFTEVGNYSGGDGMQSQASLDQTTDVDTVLLTYSPFDNPYGRASVELIQKTYVVVSIDYERNDATDQTKYFYFRVANTLIDGSLQETRFQWSNSTTTATTSGVGVEWQVDSNPQVSASWSTTTDQGVDAFAHRVESRIQSATRIFEFQADTAMQQQYVEIPVDCGFHWNLNTVDNNWAEYVPDASTLKGHAQCYSVIGFGELKILKNHDGTLNGCPKTYHEFTDTGNPELWNDRTVHATVSYVKS